MLNYQSNGTGFDDWAILLTLSLAPLIAHLIAGVPEPGMSNFIIGYSTRHDP
jgi:hypothetical protein